MTDQKISPRFVFLGRTLQTTQVGPDAFVDAYPTIEKPQFEAARSGDTVRIHLSRQDTGHQSSLDWPAPGAEPVELGPALLEIIERADRDGGTARMRDLAGQIRSYLGASGD